MMQIRLFIIYAHKNKGLRQELHKRLKPMEDRGEINVWYDGEIIPGQEWKKDIIKHLQEANLVLYLASRKSLDSKNCNDELARTIKEIKKGSRKKYIPIVLHQCSWKTHEVNGQELGDIQALPKNGKAITRWKNRDEAWQDVVEGIGKAIKEMRSPTEETMYADSLFHAANFLCGLSKYQNALENYTQAIKLQQDYAMAYNNRGVILNALGRHQEALDDCNQAIKLQQDYAMAYNNRGVILNALGRHQEALDDCNQAIKLQQDYAMAYNNRGVILNALGRHQEALVDCNQAIKLQPDLTEAYYNRSIVLCKLDRLEEALDDCNQAIKLQPDLAMAYSKRGNVLGNLDRHEEALADYNKAIKLKPDHVSFYINRINPLNALGRNEEAIANQCEIVRLAKKP